MGTENPSDVATGEPKDPAKGVAGITALDGIHVEIAVSVSACPQDATLKM